MRRDAALEKLRGLLARHTCEHETVQRKPKELGVERRWTDLGQRGKN